VLYGTRSLALFSLAAFREMTWHCLSVPCAATGREIRGGSIACRRMSDLWKTPRHVWRVHAEMPVVVAFLLSSSLLKKS